MALFRLKVVEYFDSIINEIDYFTEKEILAHQGNHRVELHLNERRQVLLSRVNEIQQHCLRQIKQLRLEDEKINNKNDKINGSDGVDSRIKERIFTKYCFTHVYSGLVYLFAVDYYVSDREIGRFKACLKEMLKDCWNRGKEAQPLIQLLDPCLRAVESNKELTCSIFWSKSRDLFEPDSPVILVNEPFQLDDMWIEGPMKVDSSMSCQAIETKLIHGGRRVEISDDTLLDTCDTLEQLVKHNVQIYNLEISNAVRSRDEFDRLMNLLPSKKQIVTDVNLIVEKFDDNFWTVPLKVDLRAVNISLVVRQKELLLSQLFEWLSYSQLRSLRLRWYGREEEKLSRQHLSCLTSLQELLIESDNLLIDADALCDLGMLRSLRLYTVKYKDKYDWRFLDSVRHRLESFKVSASKSVSSSVLRDMPKLKELVISGSSNNDGLEIEDTGEKNFELFTGLGALEKLTISFLKSEQEEKMYNPRHFQHLYSLQHLDLAWTKSSRLLTLFSTQTNPGSSCCPLPCFSNLRSLRLIIHSLDSLCPKPFDRLTQLTSLDVSFYLNDEKFRVAREHFHGLDSLTHLSLRSSFSKYYTVDSEAFAHLTKLVDIRLSNVKQTFEELQASGLFDPCKSVKSISVNMGWEPGALFFDKLDRFVFVKRGDWNTTIPYSK